MWSSRALPTTNRSSVTRGASPREWRPPLIGGFLMLGVTAAIFAHYGLTGGVIVNSYANVCLDGAMICIAAARLGNTRAGTAWFVCAIAVVLAFAALGGTLAVLGVDPLQRSFVLASASLVAVVIALAAMVTGIVARRRPSR